MRYLSIFVISSALLLSACGAKLPSITPYKMEISQGNLVTSKMLLQLRPGMTKSQVRYIMGTPLVVDGFRENRWDYFYELRKQGKLVNQRRVILDFDKDVLTAVRGDPVPEDNTSATLTTPKSVTPPKPVVEKSIWDKLAFWRGDANTDQTTDAKAKVEIPKVATETPQASVATESAKVVAEVAAEAVQTTAATTEAGTEAAATSALAATAVATEAAAVAEPVAPSVNATAPVANDHLARQDAAVALDNTKDVESSVSAWANAWRSQNITAYLAAYASDFKPEGFSSKKAWEAQRASRLAPSRGKITLDIADLQVTHQGNQAVATFVQKYSSKVYADQVNKQLNLRLDAAGKKWLITRETVLANGAGAKASLPPEGSSEHLDGVIEQIGF